jgi:hypothetical protein
LQFGSTIGRQLAALFGKAEDKLVFIPYLTNDVFDKWASWVLMTCPLTPELPWHNKAVSQ